MSQEIQQNYCPRCSSTDPEAPGFFGTYHAACKLALEPFGVPSEVAVALGTLVHGVFWVTLTALGLVVLRVRRTPFGELDRAADGSEDSQIE